MARSHLYEPIMRERAGALSILIGASVEVREQGTTNLIAASIYAALTGGSPLANPLTSDANGAVSFYLNATQDVDLYVTAAGVTPFTLSNAPVLPAMADLVNRNAAGTILGATLSSPTINNASIVGGTYSGTVGAASFAKGTVALPGVSFTTDPDTGLTSTADNTLEGSAGAVKAWKSAKTNAVFARTTFGTADFPASLSGDTYEFQTAQPSLMAIIDRESGADKIAGPALTIYADKYAPINDGVASALGIWARRAWNDTALSQAMQALDIHAQHVAGFKGNLAGQYTRALGTESYATSTQSVATYTVAAGVVTGTSISTAGAGYATAPFITAPADTTATFRATMTNGALTAIVVTNTASSRANGTYALTISAPSGGSVFGAVVFAGEAGGGTSPQYLETIGLELNPYRVTANASTDYSLSTVPGSQVGRSIALNLIATGNKKHTVAAVIDSHDHTNGNYYTGIDFIQGSIDSTTKRAIRLPNDGRIKSRTVGGSESDILYMGSSDSVVVNAPTAASLLLSINNATIATVNASGLSTSAVTATGALTGQSAALSDGQTLTWGAMPRVYAKTFASTVDDAAAQNCLPNNFTGLLVASFKTAAAGYRTGTFLARGWNATISQIDTDPDNIFAVMGDTDANLTLVYSGGTLQFRNRTGATITDTSFIGIGIA